MQSATVVATPSRVTAVRSSTFEISAEAAAPGLPSQPHPPTPVREDFDTDTLPIAFQWLRSPAPEELFSLRERKGHLRLYGRETIGSLFTQALVARRQQSHCYSASTIVEVEPEHFQQMAGLICYYNSSKFHYFYVSRDEELGKQTLKRSLDALGHS